ARTRLSKTPEAYQASRATHAESQYEALLAAGRTRWFPGERVRYYRSSSKKYVWLPEETEEAGIGNEWRREMDASEPSSQPTSGRGQAVAPTMDEPTKGTGRSIVEPTARPRP